VTPEEKMAALHEQHATAILRYVRSEDLVQEVMIRAWRNLASVPDEPEPARRWLFTVARRTVIDHLRGRNSRVAEVAVADLTGAAPAEDPVRLLLAVDSLRQAFGELSQGHRTVVSGLYLRGVPAGELAEQLGVPVGTVKSRAHHALRRLRAAVE
jgi:RNA polymerase sigma-70 factor, ECF subfamily